MDVLNYVTYQSKLVCKYEKAYLALVSLSEAHRESWQGKFTSRKFKLQVSKLKSIMYFLSISLKTSKKRWVEDKVVN